MPHDLEAPYWERDFSDEQIALAAGILGRVVSAPSFNAQCRIIAAALQKVRDEQREADARIAKVGWLTSKRSVIGDADREQELCEEIESAIRSQKP